mmetsp:Transcript_31050/g.49842  ORF Transcript_31050/g.49842 Transcript_31050/m.49842 type:complete len:238 (+) Transcript_31050:1029-1742(+)
MCSPSRKVMLINPRLPIKTGSRRSSSMRSCKLEKTSRVKIRCSNGHRLHVFGQICPKSTPPERSSSLDWPPAPTWVPVVFVVQDLPKVTDARPQFTREGLWHTNLLPPGSMKQGDIRFIQPPTSSSHSNSWSKLSLSTTCVTVGDALGAFESDATVGEEEGGKALQLTSQDCGQTYETVYPEGYAGLSSFGSYLQTVVRAEASPIGRLSIRYEIDILISSGQVLLRLDFSQPSGSSI